jgi:hypothetical protein
MIASLLNVELEGICKEVVVAYWKYYPNMCLEGLRKTIKIYVAKLKLIQLLIMQYPALSSYIQPLWWRHSPEQSVLKDSPTVYLFRRDILIHIW